MLKLMYKLNKLIKLINNYFYILPILSYISSLKNNKIFNSINNILKIIIIINIVLGISFIILFTDFINPINVTYSIYIDLIESYIELIKHSWKELMSYINKLLTPGSTIKKELESVIQESATQIQSEIKSVIESSIEEALDRMREDDIQAIDNLLKQLALISSGIFIFYFIFVLPGSSIDSSELVSYNWINQSLIELKISITDLIINLLGGNGGNPGSPKMGVGGRDLVDVALSPINIPKVDVVNSPISPVSSLGVPTITPNSPITNIQTITEYVDHSTETTIDAMSVGRFVETVNILAQSFTAEETEALQSGVNQAIKTITD
jgi:hypothetical protein